MNLPNKISLSRIIVIPFMVFFYLASFIPYGKLVAALLFGIVSLTDFLDGYIARKYNMVTDLGKFLDSIADKMLMASGLVLVVADGTIMAPYGAIAAVIILVREFFVSSLRQIAAKKGIALAADMWGKIKANFQPIAVFGFMICAFLKTIQVSYLTLDILTYISYGFLAIAVVLTVVSGLHYLIKNIQVFKSESNN